jgi:hypothetical protein
LKTASRLLLLTILPLVLVAPTVRADGGGPWTLGPGEWYSEILATRASSNAEFLLDGRDAAIPGGTRFQERRVTSYTEFGWTRSASVSIALPFENLTHSAGRSEITNSGLSDLALGLRLRLRDGSPALSLDAIWKAPLGYQKYAAGIRPGLAPDRLRRRGRQPRRRE